MSFIDACSTRFLRRSLRAVLGCVVALVVFAAPALAGSIADIKSKGVVLIGIQGDNPPWGFVNSDGVQEGFDADIGKAFASHLGVDVKFVPLAVANRITALTTGQVDVLFATMAMLPDRAKAVQYSKPYVSNIIYLLGAKADTIKRSSDMGNFSIGVPSASVQDTQVTKNAPAGTRILRYADDEAAIQGLISGQVQAVGGNMFYIDRLEKARPGVFETKFEFTRLHNGACSKLGDRELNAELNVFVDKIKGNGVLAAAYAKWMKVPVPEFPTSVKSVPFVVN
jgi:polar amino acid transport system substrate-binding protein